MSTSGGQHVLNWPSSAQFSKHLLNLMLYWGNKDKETQRERRCFLLFRNFWYNGPYQLPFTMMMIAKSFQRKPQFPSLRHIHRFPCHFTCCWLFFVALICSLVEWALVTPSLCPEVPPLQCACWHRSGSQLWGLVQGQSTRSSSPSWALSTSLAGQLLVLCMCAVASPKKVDCLSLGTADFLLCFLLYIIVLHSPASWLFFKALDFLRILCSLVFFGSHFLCFTEALWAEVKSRRVQRYSLNPFTFHLSLVIICFT